MVHELCGDGNTLPMPTGAVAFPSDAGTGSSPVAASAALAAFHQLLVQGHQLLIQHINFRLNGFRFGIPAKEARADAAAGSSPSPSVSLPDEAPPWLPPRT